MNITSKIAIIGGGIGGLICAISLKRKGFNHLQAFERRTEAQSMVMFNSGLYAMNCLKCPT